MEMFDRKENILYYFGNPAGVITEQRVIIDSLFAKKDFETFAEKESGGLMIEVKEGVYRGLITGKDILSSKDEITYKVYQLKKDSPFTARFISLDERLNRGYGMPGKKDYDMVYEGISEDSNIDSIWEIFEMTMPQDYRGRPIAVSDVIEISDGREVHSYYLEPFGVKRIDFE